MSKSLGNFIDLERIDEYVLRFGLDALRYFLITQGPLRTTDADFAEAKFGEVYNADLANTLGNCFSRVANMTARYFGGRLPAAGEEAEADRELRRAAERSVAAFEPAVAALQLDGAAAAALELVGEINSYIERTQPFKLARVAEQLPRVGTILYHCAEAIRIASLLLWPLMPGKMAELWRRIGCEAYAREMADGSGRLGEWTRWGGLEAGEVIQKGDALFPRFEP